MSPVLSRCCQAVELALKLGQAQQAAALCRHILSHYRWHLRAHLLLAQACLEQQDAGRAEQRFRLVLSVDPECAEAYSGLGVLALDRGDAAGAVRALALAFENLPESDDLREALQQALARQAGRAVPPPAFTPACVGRFYLRRGLPEPAAQSFGSALRQQPGRKDLRLACATAFWQSGRPEQALELCRPLLRERPRPLVALLLAAAAALQEGNAEEGRRYLAEARAWDPDDERARTLFGRKAGLPLPPGPAEVPDPPEEDLRRLLGMVQEIGPQVLPTGAASEDLAAHATRSGQEAIPAPTLPAAFPWPPSEPATPRDPDLRRFQEVVLMVDRRLFGGEAPPPPGPLPASAVKAGRRPAEVLLAWYEGLQARFGTEEIARIDSLLQELAQAAERRGVVGRVVYLDRPAYADIPSPDPHSPDQIKSFLDSLDQRLEEEGLDFHYLSLIGGDDLLPFARLPNPSEDTDTTVPSDNLYASRDPTYVIPERATGRLPDGGTADAAFLLGQLHRWLAGRRGEGVSLPPAPPLGCLGTFLSWFGGLATGRQKAPASHRFGLSAQVWTAASAEVYRLLPGTEPLRTCPPDGRETILPAWLGGVAVAYFNLHGAQDSPNWYGQRDMALAGEGPLMPVAFTPAMVPESQVEGQVIYSEACYGANLLGKDPSSAISLRFLAQGALGFVGSTVISYGVSVPPLADADLLGAFFWQNVLQGERLGDALLKAKVEFTRQVYQRQGYLDGDDMKTLIEFVLYGDPLAPMPCAPGQVAAHAAAIEQPVPPVLCARHAKSVPLHHLSGDLVARVRRSLTWLQQGDQVTSMQAELRTCCPGGLCQGHCRTARAKNGPEALVFTARREVRTEDGTALPQVARVVVDARGRIIKMAVTR